jgi:hypothetical protein
MTIPQQIEIDRLQRELDEREIAKAITPFANALGESIAIMLATQPYDKWPSVAKTAFQHVQRKMPSAAQMYRSRLPTK